MAKPSVTRTFTLFAIHIRMADARSRQSKASVPTTLGSTDSSGCSPVSTSSAPREQTTSSSTPAGPFSFKQAEAAGEFSDPAVLSWESGALRGSRSPAVEVGPGRVTLLQEFHRRLRHHLLPPGQSRMIPTCLCLFIFQEHWTLRPPRRSTFEREAPSAV